MVPHSVLPTTDDIRHIELCRMLLFGLVLPHPRDTGPPHSTKPVDSPVSHLRETPPAMWASCGISCAQGSNFLLDTDSDQHFL